MEGMREDSLVAESPKLEDTSEIENGAQEALAKKLDVNVHQMFIELSPSLSKKPVTEGDQSQAVWNQEKAVVKIDSGENESTSAHQGVPGTAAPPTEDSTGQNQHNEKDGEGSEGLFATAVEEEVLQAAKERQRKKSLLFGADKWAEKPQAITMKDVIHGKTDEHFNKGMEHMKNEAFEKAVVCFNKAINLRPKETQYYMQRGECYLNLCDFQSAILNYKKACVLEPDNVSLYTRLAFIYYFQGQCLFDQKLYPEALEAFSRATEMRPNVIGFHTRSIACLAALQRHGECLALVNKRLETERDNADLYVMRARLHELFRNTTLCYYDIKDALGLDPQHPEATRTMAHLEQRARDLKQQATQLNLLGRHRDALQKISLAIETDPSVADFHVTRGALHRRLGDFNSAIDDYLLAMDKTDHNEESQVYLESQRQLLLTYNDFAVECFTKGFYEEAIILLNKAIKGEKREKGLYINRGDCFFRQGQLQFALQDYHQALEIDNSDTAIRARISVVHNEFGVQDYQDKNFQEAESRFTLAIQHNPRVGQYYISRARARQMMENIEAARQDILVALHLDPSNDEIIGIMARLFPGKTVRDVMASPLAATAKTILANLVVTASPVKLEPLKNEIEPRKEGMKTTDDEEVIPPIAGSLWKPGGCFPDLKACMQEKEFNFKIAREKKLVNDAVKKALNERKTLKYQGARVKSELPEAQPYTRIGGSGRKKETLVVKATQGQPTGWGRFKRGITMGDVPDTVK